MARVIGKAFKIKKRDVKSYGYVKPNARRFTRNGGVTAIAAINGRGAYLRHRRNAGGAGPRTARSMMNGLSKTARLNRARALTRNRPGMSSNPSAGIARARARIRRALKKKASASPVRRKTRRAVASKRPTTKKRKSMKANARRHRRNSAKRGAPGRKTRRVRRVRRARAASASTPKRRRRSRKAAKTTTRRRRRRTAKLAANPRRRRRIRRNAAAAPKRRRRRRKAAAVATPVRRRRRRKAAKTTTRRRRRKAKLVANPRRRRRRKLAANPRRRRRRVRRHSANPRRRRRRVRRHAANRRRRSRRVRKNGRRRRSHRRNGMMSNRRRRSRRVRKNARRRRSHRRNGMMANRRRRTRRSHRRNGRRFAFKRNGFMATLGEVAKLGALTTLGFIGHKALTKLFCDNIVDRLLGSAGTVTPPAAPAVSGLEMLQPYRNVIGGAVVGVAGIFLADKVVKDARTKMFITAGIATSFVHATAVALLSKFAPQVTGYLAGHDGTAASISAMYGLGAGASIQPHYAPISATGEYFAQNGIGEYFAQNGLGNGLGSYGANPDLMQAAAGYGIVENTNSDHVNPGDDLDRQLSIAEAAAGVGSLPAYEAAAGMGKVQPFEASAGIGEYFAQNGFGAVSSIQPTADTWIPGGGPSPQIWAGTRSISEGQSLNELNSAGILETAGNQGVFG